MADKQSPSFGTGQSQAKAKAPDEVQHYQEKKIVSSRPSREGDDGYQLNTVCDQVTVILEDGTEKVIDPKYIDEVKEAREKSEKEQYEKDQKELEKQQKERDKYEK